MTLALIVSTVVVCAAVIVGVLGYFMDRSAN